MKQQKRKKSDISKKDNVNLKKSSHLVKNKFNEDKKDKSDSTKTSDGKKIRKRLPKMSKNLLLQTNTLWFEMPNRAGSTKIFSAKNEIEEVYKKEVEAYKETKTYKKVSWALKQGTLKDKEAAYRVLFADSLAHNLSYLESLISVTTPKCKREAIMAMATLHTIILSAGLPNNRKLISLKERDLSKPITESCALLWLVEDKIKVLYNQLLENLNELTFDSFEATKVKAIYMLAEFLANLPEQEQMLLTKLCNKLGDPSTKVCSRVSHLLTQLIIKHPNMRLTVVKEVERFVYRPKVTVYYALNFLAQVLLDENSNELAQKLISIYLRLFTTLASTKIINDRIMKALLTGASRAYPYVKNGITKEQTDSLFFISHQVKFSTSIQALILLHQVLDIDNIASDRFYSTLYKKLLHPDLPMSKYQHKFVNLLYRALKYDVNLNRVRAFIKRILQVAMYQGPGLSCAFLYLISRLGQEKPQLLTTNDDDDDNEDEECYKDIELLSDGEEVPIDNATETTPQSSYDPLKRDPRFCGAEKSQLAEQWVLNHFYHPSVRVFQEQVKDGITYSGDPLQDFTLARFLEKFVYRNPKKDEKQPNQTSVFAKRYHPKSGKDILSSNYLNQNEGNIPKDEKFIFDYLRFKKEAGEQLGIKEEDDDVDSVASDDFDGYLENYEKSTGLSFAGNLMASDKKGDLSEEEDYDDDEEDDEVDFENDENFNAEFDEFSDLDNDEEEEQEEPSSKRQKMANLLQTEDFNDSFDEEENQITSKAVFNQDKSHAKQLQWEQGRHHEWKKGKGGNKKQKNKKHSKRK